MDQVQNVKDILEAISSVKERAAVALANGDLPAYSNLMLDLLALERCLVYQTAAMVA